jgi:hypothetical protein
LPCGPLWPKRGRIESARLQYVDSTRKVQDALVNDGVNGLIVMGACGENNSLDPEEKCAESAPK